jgi:hypothetical protein
MAISNLVKGLDINYEETFAERKRLLNFSNNKAKEDELEKGIERVKKDPEKLATEDKETSGILGALSVAIGIVVKLVKKMITFIIDKIKSIAKYAKMLRDLGKAMWNSCWKGSLKKTAKRTKTMSGKLKSFKGKGAIIAGIAAVVSGLVYSIITNKKPEEEKEEEQSPPPPEAGGGSSGGAGASGDFSLTPAPPTLGAPAATTATATATPATPTPATATPTPATPAVASSASKSDSTSTPEAVSATPISKAGEPVEAEDPKTQSEKQIKGSGIKVRPTGDVWQGGPLSKTAVGVALAIQDQVKGFLYYTGLNDAYHKQKRPNSQHASGQGLDFVLDHMPSVKESQAIKEQIKLIAGVNPGQVMNEYYDPPQGNKAAYTTGPHMHVGVKNSASGLASQSKKIEKTIIATVETNKTQNNIYRKAV